MVGLEFQAQEKTGPAKWDWKRSEDLAAFNSLFSIAGSMHFCRSHSVHTQSRSFHGSEICFIDVLPFVTLKKQKKNVHFPVSQ